MWRLLAACGRDAVVPARAGAGVAVRPGDDHRAVQRRLHARQPGAHRRRGAAGAAEAAVRRREPGGRQRQHRHGRRGQGHARRADAGRQHRRAAGDQRPAVPEHALRHGQGHRAHQHPRRAAERAGGDQRPGRAGCGRPAGAAQAGARQDHLRLDRPGLAVASGHGIAGHECQGEPGASAVSGLAGRRHGPAARRRAGGRAAGRLGRRARQGRQAQDAGRDVGQALSRCCPSCRPWARPASPTSRPTRGWA